MGLFDFLLTNDELYEKHQAEQERQAPLVGWFGGVGGPEIRERGGRLMGDVLGGGGDVTADVIRLAGRATADSMIAAGQAKRRHQRGWLF